MVLGIIGRMIGWVSEKFKKPVRFRGCAGICDNVSDGITHWKEIKCEKCIANLHSGMFRVHNDEKCKSLELEKIVRDLTVCLKGESSYVNCNKCLTNNPKYLGEIEDWNKILSKKTK